MVKETEQLLAGVQITFLDMTTRTIDCKSYGVGPLGVSCFRMRSNDLKLDANHLCTFGFANIVGFDLIWKWE